jgi:hypothetical protein
MSLWPGHLHPSISERNGEISACSLEPNPLPSWSRVDWSSGKVNIFLSLVRESVSFLSEVERGVGDSFCASPIVTRLIRDGLSVDRQATHVDSATGQGLLSKVATSPQLLSL